jgi:hypothetical protein
VQDIQLTLTLTEVNQLLAALGQRPYAEVFELVAKLKQQAEMQLSQNGTQPTIKLSQSKEEGRRKTK